jgi:hypothetical protein
MARIMSVRSHLNFRVKKEEGSAMIVAVAPEVNIGKLAIFKESKRTANLPSAFFSGGPITITLSLHGKEISCTKIILISCFPNCGLLCRAWTRKK